MSFFKLDSNNNELENYKKFIECLCNKEAWKSVIDEQKFLLKIGSIEKDIDDYFSSLLSKYELEKESNEKRVYKLKKEKKLNLEKYNAFKKEMLDSVIDSKKSELE